LAGYPKDDLVTLITDIAKGCPQAKEFLTVKFADKENINDILESNKQIVKNEFFPKRGFGKLNLRVAKKAISDFKKINPDIIMIVDIMLFYVENCVEFTAEFGDINENFFISAETMYGQVIKAVNNGGMVLFDLFAERLKQAAVGACDGWGVRDSMMDMYYELHWVNDSDV
jgi:hypothetical protein